MQTFKSWRPIEHVPEYLSGVFILQHFAGSMTVVCDGDFGNGQLLVLRFEGFEAVATHEEFAHQWPGESAVPKLPKSPGSNWTFPFLQVENSEWAADSVQAVTFGRTPCHYSIVSGSDIVDILSLEPPDVAWTSVEAVELVMQAAANLGAA
ncbi:hypothetical protein VC279_08095 [Xanthomonas sp. WHRI 10064A]|uniref:hypothetical protein n=1 Tax=unclassified Xanthomonas TaxID=2643310 RepID=UPI002B23397A|nr:MULTISPECIES: hypothetical protein [unclassified Xanthomonas]MEA9586254.1 hypothetical protein [Xanthomonas sp. WHRI 10064B]MEA9614681.1 hypothetical protein [Xanthomonas sp. WHRI 10064A]